MLLYKNKNNANMNDLMCFLSNHNMVRSCGVCVVKLIHNGIRSFFHRERAAKVKVYGKCAGECRQKVKCKQPCYVPAVVLQRLPVVLLCFPFICSHRYAGYEIESVMDEILAPAFPFALPDF